MDQSRQITEDDQLFPLWAAASVTGLSVQTLRRLGKRGAIPIVRPAGPTGNMFLSQRTILEMVTYAPASWWMHPNERERRAAQPRDRWGCFKRKVAE
jgi:hypothetical protein